MSVSSERWSRRRRGGVTSAQSVAARIACTRAYLLLELIADCTAAADRHARRRARFGCRLAAGLGSWLVGLPLIPPLGMMTNKRIAAAACPGFHALPTWPPSCLTPLRLSELVASQLSDNVTFCVTQGRVTTACSLCSEKCKQGDVSDDERLDECGRATKCWRGARWLGVMLSFQMAL